MSTQLILTKREVMEIQHSMLYVKYTNHGTVGHNLLVIVNKFAIERGFILEPTGGVLIPEDVVITE